MKLSSISLIASALAATAGNTIAAPGPLHARSLQQGNLFERDIDNVDLFTRNPPNPEHPWQPHLPPNDGWHYPVGPCPALRPELLVPTVAEDHVDPWHYQHSPQPLIDSTRNHRQNVRGLSQAPPPTTGTTEPRHRPTSRSARYRRILPAPHPQHSNYQQPAPIHQSPHHAQQALHHPNPAQSATHPQPQALWQPPHSENLSQEHIDNAHQHRLAGRLLFIAQAVARHGAANPTVTRRRANYYRKVADDLKKASDDHFAKQRSLLQGEEVSRWWHVRDSERRGNLRGDTEIRRLWAAIENEHPETKEARDAIKKEIEQMLDEHEWNMWYPGQPYPGHPGQHQ